MPKYKFRWDAFDVDTARELADAFGYRTTAGVEAREWLVKTVKRPNDAFVQLVYARLLHTPWFSNFRGLEQIVEQLLDRDIGPLGRPRSQSGYVKYVRDCRNSKTVRALLRDAMVRFGETDGDPPGFIRKFVCLKPSDQQPDHRDAHPYQLRAWESLSTKLAESESTKSFQGLLVMPTGSGKTFTAVRWLVENVINRGGRVLWVAHRHELLEQAAEAFDRAIFLAEPRDRLIRRRLVSSRHCPASQINSEDDILICSVGSLARNSEIVEQVLSDHFLVIDEAHHAPAKSYRDLIQRVNGRSRKRVLGLTATPTRTIESERPELVRLFGTHAVFEVRIQELIDQQYLAKPVPVRVGTDAKVEGGVTSQDLEHLERFRDLTEEWKNRIAKLESRNSLIVRHYCDARKKYGKTIVFAINVLHAHLLTAAFQKEGVEAACITSYHFVGDSDAEPEAAAHKEILGQFRNPDSGMDVLINVMILTEGFDMPTIQTVFLTRPTQSEILLRQMVGRALRGLKAGGTSLAYLVSFEDHWERFREMESPFGRLSDICPPIVDGVSDQPEVPKVLDELAKSETLPYEMILAAAAELRRMGSDQPLDVFEAVPHGWFILEPAVEDDSDEPQDAASFRIHVYEHQKTCWDALIDYLEVADERSLRQASRTSPLSQFFGDCDAPRPSDHNVEALLGHYQRGGEKPVYHLMADRTRLDPYTIARRIHEEKANKFALVDEAFGSPLIRAIYRSRRDYVSAVDQSIYELQYPEDAVSRVRSGTVIFHPRPDQLLRPGPTHDLQKLMASVLDDGKRLLGLDSVPSDFKLDWTQRLIKGWYGMAHYDRTDPHGSGRIRINQLLDSPDVSAATMQFLLWHEYLHLFLKQPHTPTFREVEARWPGKIDADRELDSLNERFGITYW